MPFKMAPRENFGTVFNLHFVANMDVSSAVSTQYTNVTDMQPDRQTTHNGIHHTDDSITR